MDKCAHCGNQAKGVCKGCHSVAWCGEQCKHAHWDSEHADVCHIIGNPLHTDNIETSKEVEAALEVALVQVAGHSLENDAFLGYGNAIADAFAEYDVDETTIGDAIEWLFAYEAGEKRIHKKT